MVEITAAKVLARFNYESTDFDPDEDETTSYTNVEYIIDDIIDFINLKADQSMSSMSGTAGSKTVTVDNDQNAVIKLILPVMLRDVKYKVSDSAGLGPLSVSKSVGGMDPMMKELFDMALERLIGESEIDDIEVAVG